jgi:CheY-like chemotaxis protein
MGGSLDIQSTLGQGTVVTVSLSVPKMPSQTNGKPQQLNKFSALEQPIHILLAEDDADVADLVMLLLAERGIQVTHVNNGARALEALDEQDFDLLLMDLNMPVMSGYQAMEQLRKNGNTISVVIMSASAIDAQRGCQQNLACDGYLLKPVDIDDLLAIIEQVIT